MILLYELISSVVNMLTSLRCAAKPKLMDITRERHLSFFLSPYENAQY